MTLTNCVNKNDSLNFYYKNKNKDEINFELTKVEKIILKQYIYYSLPIIMGWNVLQINQPENV